MQLLLTQAWPWLFLGSLLALLGITSLDLPPREWLAFLVSLPFILLPDRTKTEKRELDQPAEDTASSNPGCFLLLVGACMVMYGLFRLFN